MEVRKEGRGRPGTQGSEKAKCSLASSPGRLIKTKHRIRPTTMCRAMDSRTVQPAPTARGRENVTDGEVWERVHV